MELSGSHEILACSNCHESCSNCHNEVVWYSTNKDLMICKNCHLDQWETLTNNKHGILLTEGIIQIDDVKYKVRYCSTCHFPHKNDFLRIGPVDGEDKYYPFDDFIPLCLNCHSLDGTLFQVKLTPDGSSENTTTITTINTVTTTTTKIQSTIIFVSGESSDFDEITDIILNMFPSPIFLVAFVVIVAMSVLAVTISFRRKPN
ncbi:hypothetical protein ACFL96_09850 [Thermoproteota archaeon]